MTMRFTKVKYDGESVVLALTETKGLKTEETRTVTSREEPHPDFVAALAVCLAPALELCELPLAFKQGLRVQSVSLSEDDDGNRGAVVTMLKTLKAVPAPLVLNTPHVSMREDASGHCSMPPALAGALDDLEAEARAFLAGKRAQGDLFPAVADDDADDETEAGETRATLTFGGQTVTTTVEAMKRAAERIGERRTLVER